MLRQGYLLRENRATAVIAGCINRPDGSCGCDEYPPRERDRLLRAWEANELTELELSYEVWPDAMHWSPAVAG